MKYAFTFQLSVLSLALLLGYGPAWADRLPLEGLTASQSASPPAKTQAQTPEEGPDFLAGVKAYREGNYKQANRIFSSLHKQAPEKSQYTYYLAITEGQLGRFQQCKTLYEEIITLDPHSKAAYLARQGLSYLPKENELDLPPRFQAATTPEKADAKPTQGQTPAQAQAGQSPNASMADAMKNSMQQGMQGMSPQDWMALQMMMGQQGGMSGQGGGMMNPMLWMMPAMMGAQGNNSSYDPNAMSNMMMNQMMSGFNMGGSSNENQ